MNVRLRTCHQVGQPTSSEGIFHATRPRLWWLQVGDGNPPVLERHLHLKEVASVLRWRFHRNPWQRLCILVIAGGRHGVAF